MPIPHSFTWGYQALILLPQRHMKDTCAYPRTLVATFHRLDLEIGAQK